MECEETRVDMREFNKAEMELTVRNTQLIFRINHTMPFTEEYDALVRELFGDRIGEGTRIMAPFNLVSSDAHRGALRLGTDYVAPLNGRGCQLALPTQYLSVQERYPLTSYTAGVGHS